MKTIAFILLFSVAAAAGAQTVSVGSPSGRCGQSVTVPVSIDSASGLLSVEFRIAFDNAALTVANVTPGTLTSNFALSQNAGGNSLRVAMASGTPVSGSGTIANVTFNVGAAASGTSALTISNVLVNDAPRNGTSGAAAITCPHAPAAATYIAPLNGATNVAAPVTLRWNAAAGATSYRVNFNGTTLTTSATSQAVTTASGTAYAWSVTSVNADAMTPGPTWTFTTAGTACPTPPAPQNVAARGEVLVGAPFDVTWSAVPGATAYLIEEIGASTATVTATSATFTKSAPGTFQYRVAARSACADGPFSAPVTVHVTARPPLPANARVLPIAGSAAGAFGSSYRTSVQLYNACGVEMQGMMIFHLLGASGSDDDPSLAYRLAPGETLSYPDLVAALGTPSGLGSLDIVPSGYQQTPWTVVRIFNDAGASGTTGMTFDALGLADALQAGQRGVVVAPIDPARARMNIGIRTLRDGATLTITVKDRRGATISTRRESYPATYLTQFPATGLTGDEVLLFDVEAGSAIVYASTNDNVTQDPSVQIARPLPPMP
jgi:hypothetical protein